MRFQKIVVEIFEKESLKSWDSAELNLTGGRPCPRSLLNRFVGLLFPARDLSSRGAVRADSVTVQFNLFAVIITSWLNRPSRLSEGFRSWGKDGLTFGLIKKTRSPFSEVPWLFSFSLVLCPNGISFKAFPGYFHQSTGNAFPVPANLFSFVARS